jgi:capsular polysaccharide biosynthesis protein
MNIGTNYTERRKMANEDELVNFLTSKGYVEVFSELLTTKQKIAIFKNAESVIGAIGGGICNVLFSKPECKLTAIVSPYFLDVNTRFKYSIDKVKLTLFVDSKNVETTSFKKYMRVKCGDIVGEITNIENG